MNKPSAENTTDGAENLPPKAEAISMNDRDSAAVSGLSRVVNRIKDYPHRYTDDSGAQFILEYHKRSPDKLLGFFKRMEREGYRMKFTEEENAILEEVRNKTSPMGLLPQARIVDGAKTLLTRRNLLRRASWLGGALLLDRTKNLLGGAAGQAKEMASHLEALKKEMDDEKTTAERRAELEQEIAETAEKIKGPMHALGKILKDNSATFTALVIIGYSTIKQGADIYEHANQKVDKIINNTSRMIDYRLGYSVGDQSSPGSSMSVG